MRGDTLILKDDSNPEWLGVMPPDSMDLWVCREFLEEGVVLPERLNVRSGPSLNHSVVGVVDQGDLLTIRGESGEWLRIAPPETSVVWISRKYAEIEGVPAAETGGSVVIRVEPSPEPEPAAEIVRIVTQPEVKIAHIGLVNIVAGRTVCPEILQHDATPERLAEETARLMADTPERIAMLDGYAEVRQLLGAKKAAENAAAILCEG